MKLQVPAHGGMDGLVGEGVGGMALRFFRRPRVQQFWAACGRCDGGVGSGSGGRRRWKRLGEGGVSGICPHTNVVKGWRFEDGMLPVNTAGSP